MYVVGGVCFLAAEGWFCDGQDGGRAGVWGKPRIVGAGNELGL